MKAMACKTSFELHHHFPKLAEESGFTFNTHRPRIHIDWNKIRLINIDSLIKERKFVIIEQHLNDILDCVFESEFDVRILDEGVMKMFRLAQLAVEYQQFCRHYLDRSVYVLREEITSLAQDLDTCKKELREKDEEIRRLRKRSRHSFKTPLPYGNDNIATMILKTLSHKSDIFSSPSNDTMHYNKCGYCDKVFLNQLYLKSHLSRRHPNVTELPQKDKTENNTNSENTKLGAEIIELKNKITEMQNIIASKNEVPSLDNETKVTTKQVQIDIKKDQEIKKDMKDAEVSTNNEEYLLHKIEEWKKQEHENYNKEMDKFRIQILETINTIKEKENHHIDAPESNLITQLHETIKQQGTEILALKKELTDSRTRTEKENVDRNKEAEAQVSFWAGRAEAQSKQYELLLQKLNDVARDAKESRALAEAERERATQLNHLLQQSLNSRRNENEENMADLLLSEKNTAKPNVRKSLPKSSADQIRYDQKPDSISLEKLHRKAQELLNTASISSTSSDASSVKNYISMESKPFQTKNIIVNDKTTNENDIIRGNTVISKLRKNEETQSKNKQESLSRKTNKLVNGPKLKKKKNNISTKNTKRKNGPTIMPGSPMKLVRAKITEEVNTRLASAGVDPLKSRLPRYLFEKQRLQIHQQQELKAKKNPTHEKVRHSILAYLDSSVTDLKKDEGQVPDYISPTKVNNPFKNFTSVISNVKTKALSLVKLNDSNGKEKQKSKNTEVAKRAMSLLKTPPGSASSSPITRKRSPLGSLNTTENVINVTNDVGNAGKFSKSTSKITKKSSSPHKTLQRYVPTSNSEDISEESDHKYHTTTAIQHLPKSIESLIKSPARRPSSAAADYNHTLKKYTISDNNLLRTQSVTNLVNETIGTTDKVKSVQESASKLHNSSSDSIESCSDTPAKKKLVDNGAPYTVKQTKSVLKNASSTSSLNKKKVLFDMDAIQMKSVSASPSQSLTEKSDGNEKYELGLVNLDSEEWDISSIDNEPLKTDTKIQNMTRTSPKITELKEKIESQLARRVDTPATAIIGGVDVLAGKFNLVKTSSIGGSNTSLGSSILDDSESLPIANHKTIVKPKKAMENATSVIDVSDFNINKNESF